MKRAASLSSQQLNQPTIWELSNMPTTYSKIAIAGAMLLLCSTVAQATLVQFEITEVPFKFVRASAQFCDERQADLCAGSGGGTGFSEVRILVDGTVVGGFADTSFDAANVFTFLQLPAGTDSHVNATTDIVNLNGDRIYFVGASPFGDSSAIIFDVDVTSGSMTFINPLQKTDGPPRATGSGLGTGTFDFSGVIDSSYAPIPLPPPVNPVSWSLDVAETLCDVTFCYYRGNLILAYNNEDTEPAPVPEPGSLPLISTGLAGLVAISYRRKLMNIPGFRPKSVHNILRPRD